MDKILITSPIRQKRHILREYLESLDNLIIDYNKFSVNRFFILHNCYNEISNEFKFSDILIENNDNTELKEGEKTHIWEKVNLNKMSKMKNSIVEYALFNNFDYIFWVDSDTILHPNTLNRLYNMLKIKNEYIISEIFWIRYQKGGKLEPNCCEYDFYEYPDNWYKENNLYQVGGTGGIILVDTKVYKSGVNYSPLPNLQITNWEDRAFCIRATCHNYKIYCDTNYHATHLYREEDYEEYIKLKSK